MALRASPNAIQKAIAVAKDPAITDDKVRAELVSSLMAIAQGGAKRDRFGRVVYRTIAISLGAVAILVVVLGFFLELRNKTIDAAFYTLGSGAIGGLAGLFSTSGTTNDAGGATKQPDKPAKSAPTGQTTELVDDPVAPADYAAMQAREAGADPAGEAPTQQQAHDTTDRA